MKPVHFFIIVFAAVIATTTACNRPLKDSGAVLVPDSPTDTVDASAKFQVKKYTIERKSVDFNQENGSGAMIRITYDWIENPTQAVHDSVNEYILNFIRQTMGSVQRNGKHQNPEELADEFIDMYTDVVNDFGKDMPGWDYQVDCRITNPYEKLICVECNEGGYTGGNHPNYATIFQNYLVQDATPVSKEKIFSNLDSINRIAEFIFRKQNSIPQSESINEAGFDFEEDQFELNDNFTFRNDSIIFFFNNYEIAPYVMGSSDVSIAIKRLKKFLITSS